MEAEPEKDQVISVLREGFAVVTLSPKVKQCIQAPWLISLIVKVYGRNVGFSFLQSKIMALWRPSGKVDCVDLGKELFLIRFSMKEDYNAVLENDPWFIGEHLLSIRPWEPNFRPSTTSVSSIAVWVRLNELPIECYEVEVPKEIGKSIGNVLRIDTHTALESRGRYSKLCVQVDVGKPLIMTIIIGNIEQMVVYEGIQKLCFCCGRIGHRKEACPYVIRRTRQTGSMEAEGSKMAKEVPRDQHDPTHAKVYQAGPEEGQEDL
ncbi:uncharacterized protein At4g02000-like [Castanea sativa]|uniref:uncharacterized protein At4g02000-like n=1 Tax=Castanea sativa TaxID=21020 RepID=UPI003F653698